MRADELADLFGVSQRTAANKARQIRDILNVSQADPNWWRPSNLERNPYAWWVMINGLAVDARELPLEIQEELVRRGLIPFVPGNRGEPGEQASPEEENEPEEGTLPGGKGRIVHFKIERL